MLSSLQKKANLKILEKLRDKGAPSLSPFPGEQDAVVEDVDLDPMGTTLASGAALGIPQEEEETAPPRQLRKRRKLVEPDVEEEGDLIREPGSGY